MNSTKEKSYGIPLKRRRKACGIYTLESEGKCVAIHTLTSSYLLFFHMGSDARIGYELKRKKKKKKKRKKNPENQGNFYLLLLDFLLVGGVFVNFYLLKLCMAALCCNGRRAPHATTRHCHLSLHPPSLPSSSLFPALFFFFLIVFSTL